MLAQIILIASLPSMFCAGCATFLAYKERKQWVWFAGLSVLAGVGGVAVLNMIGLVAAHQPLIGQRVRHGLLSLGHPSESPARGKRGFLMGMSV